jgi:protein involved in polysaccharide export with SLBB domain
MSVKSLMAWAIALFLTGGMGNAWGQEKSSAALQQTTSEETGFAIRTTPAERNPRYLLRESDVLQITFRFTPEFNQTITIQPDGFVNLLSVGDMYIAGKSVPELTAALRKAYGQFLHDPVIDVELKDFEKPYFIAGGEVGRPGKYELRGQTTVAEAVAIAGGFTEKAKHSQVLLYHRAPGGWDHAKELNVKRMLTNKDLTEDIQLRPGDLIYVPKNRMSKIREFIPSTGLGLPVP